MTILLVDQMAALALAIADRGYVIESGDIVHAGSPDELRNDPALERAYLGRDRELHRRTPGSRSKEDDHGPDSAQRAASAAVRHGRHRHRPRQDRRDRAAARGERQRDRPRRPARRAALHRDPHPSRQVLHPRPLQRPKAARSRRRSPRSRATSGIHCRRRATSARAARWKRRSSHGTMHMRTHVEVDPGIGLRGFEGDQRLADGTAGRSTSRSACFRRRD